MDVREPVQYAGGGSGGGGGVERRPAVLPVEGWQKQLHRGFEDLLLLLDSLLDLRVRETEGQHLGAFGDQHVECPAGGVAVDRAPDFSVKVDLNFGKGLLVAIFIFSPKVFQFLLLARKAACVVLRNSHRPSTSC